MNENSNHISLKKPEDKSWTDPTTGEIYPGGNPNAVSQPVPQPVPQPVSQPVPQPVSYAQNNSVFSANSTEVYPGNTTIQPAALQPGMKYCKFCGSQIPAAAVICVKCGQQVEQLQGASAPNQQQIIINNTPQQTIVQGGKRIDKWVAFVLAFFLGYLGVHRFYQGKIGTGILWMLTGGMFGIGWLVDWISILTKPNPFYV